MLDALVLEAASGAPFGLVWWRRRVTVPLRRPVEVAPRRGKAEPVSTASSGEAGEASAATGVGGDRVRGVREYLPGDPLRLVHWPATARHGQILVKELEHPDRPHLDIVVDLRGDEACGGGRGRAGHGPVCSALDEGLEVTLHTAEAGGPRSGAGGRAAGDRPSPGARDRRRPAGRGERRPGDPDRRGTRALTGDPAAPRWARLLGDLSRPPEHSRALRLATLVAVVAAACAVVANDVGGGLLWILALVVIPCGAAVSYARRRSSSPLVPGILTAITIVLTVRFVLANGGASSPGELRVPLAELLVILESVRAFSLRSRRELRFALASSIALISVAGALSLGIEFAAFAAVWGVAAVAALALAHRADLGDLAMPSLDRRVGMPISLRALAATLVAVGALGAAAFMIVPAAKSSRFLAFTARLPSQIAVPSPGGLSNPSLGPDDPARPGNDLGRADLVRLLRLLRPARHLPARAPRRHDGAAGALRRRRLLARPDLRRVGRPGLDVVERTDGERPRVEPDPALRSAGRAPHGWRATSSRRSTWRPRDPT